jgi:hypothetical protein
MRRVIVGLTALALMGACAGEARAGFVTTKVYKGFTASGGGAPYSDLVGTLMTDDVQFGTNTNFRWHPFGLLSLGADVTGALLVDKDGKYKFTMKSDDGSLLFIDGKLVIDNGGTHTPPKEVSQDVTLTAGYHFFEIQFFEKADPGDTNPESGLDLNLSSGVHFASVPAPPAVVLAGIGALCMGSFAWRRRK